MPDLPTGTITFLFTDIEGSTRLWEQHPEAMKRAHSRHGEIISEAVERQGGALVRERGEGDSCFVVFPQATDAVAAVTHIQRALLAESWPEQAPIRVRAALHTGEAQLREADYNSSAVNRCARLRAIAYGGQSVLSRVTYELVRDCLPEGVSLKDLGLHRLKDLQRPEQVFQLLHPDLQPDFPPLKSLDALPTNLPQQLTRFIGREQEMREVKHLLAATRLLTLTGTGGVGKTRLALQVAADLLEDYPDGVWLVELAALSDAALVPRQVADALGVREEPNRPVFETLIDALRPKRLLLVLDNCEHLVEACAAATDTLLRRCPNVQTLATSRTALGIGGETVWRVPSLAAPVPDRRESVEVLTQYQAVQLFIDRAQVSRPGFSVTNATAPAVAQVCHRLDGIPLAIELAAARVRALSLEQILARLDDRFRLLTGGSRAALPRQQTLLATLDWSYDLLRDPERTLLCRLAVFAGGWTLDAAEAVCAGGNVEGRDVLDLLTALADQSLVLYGEQAESPRYQLLGTIRQYASERLAAQGEGDTLRRRHRDYYLSLARESKEKLAGPEQRRWLEELEREHDNLRTALETCARDPESGVIGLRLAAPLGQFWDMRGYMSEGREHLAVALAHPGAQEGTKERAHCLNGAGIAAWRQADFPAAQKLLEEALAFWRGLDEKPSMAATLNNLGILARHQGEFARAQSLLEESVGIAHAVGQQTVEANGFNNLLTLALDQSDYAGARTYGEKALGLWRQLKDEWGTAMTLGNLGDVAASQGDLAGAQAWFEEGLALKRKLGDKQGIASILANWGALSVERGELTAAQHQLAECLALCRELGTRHESTLALDGLARLALRRAQASRAALLHGAADALRDDIGAPITPDQQPEHERQLSRVRAALGEDAFEAAFAAGRALSWKEVIDRGLEELPTG